MLSSCSDFLEEESQDLIIPKSIVDYQELLYGETSKINTQFVNGYLDLMTDDAEGKLNAWGFGGDQRTKGYGYYTWQSNNEIQPTGAIVKDAAWDYYYRNILTSNIILNDVPLTKGTESEKKDMLAEAYFHRAFSYFMLVNLYGQPYDEKDANTKLGVPINLDYGVQDKLFERETVATVYDQINEDIENSIKYFKEAGIENFFFRANLASAQLLASRIFLYQKKYDKAIQYASEVIKSNPNLYNLKQQQSSDIFYQYKNPEILYTYGNTDDNKYYYSAVSKGKYVISSDLLSKYSSSDLRKQKFFKRKNNGKYFPRKSSTDESIGCFGKALRVAEAYLNRAEAYAMTDKSSEAISDINLIRSYRFTADFEVSVSPEADAITLVKSERRLELAMEDHRWFDLRRWDRPEITHKYKDPTSKEYLIFTLQKDDPAYTLSIPQSVRNFNPSMINNDRPTRNSKTE
jgi:hypothetical protein